MSEYVVTKERLRDYLYTLGFNYRTSRDKTNKQECIWLFQKDELLMDAITYYTNVKNKMVSQRCDTPKN